MYQLKKDVPFEDDIELLDESGNVVRTIHVSLCMNNLLTIYNLEASIGTEKSQ